MFKSNLKMHLCPLIFCAVGVFMCRSSVGAFFCLYCKTPYTYTHTHVGLLVSTILILVHAALTRPYLIQLLCPEVASCSFQFTSGVPPLFSFPLEERLCCSLVATCDTAIECYVLLNEDCHVDIT